MRDRILIFSSAFILVFLLGYFAHVQYFRTKANVIQFYHDKQEMLANQAALSLKAFIDERVKAVEGLAELTAYSQMPSVTILHVYKRTFDLVQGFKYLIRIDTNGNASFGYPENYPCPSQQHIRVQEKFQHAFNDAIQHNHTEIFTKNIMINDAVFICLITPLMEKDGTLLGAVLGVLDVEESLNIALLPIMHETKDNTWIMNDQGFIIYHPKHKEMLLHSIYDGADSCMQCHTSFEFEKEMLQTDTGHIIKEDNAGVKQMVAYQHVDLGHSHWIIALSTPFQDVTVAIRNLFKNNLILVLLMILAVIAGATVIYRINTNNILVSQEVNNLKIQNALVEEKNEAESRYRVLLDQSPDPVFLSTRRKLLMVNPSFEKKFGYSHDEIMNESFSVQSLIQPAALAACQRDLRQFIRSRQPYSILKINLQSRTGQLMETEVSLSRFLLGGKMVYQGIVHDVTKTKQLERERERRKHLAIVGEMAARIAHEIKNPLASIQTGIQLLESQVAANDKQHSYFERLLQEIQRVDRILKGLLTYAREEQLDLKQVNVEQVVHRVETLIRPTLEKNGLKLAISIEQNLPPIMIDEQKIEQVLWNIFLNSVQASEPGAYLSLRVERNSHGLDWYVEDQGKGIPQHIMKKIFQPFFSTRTQGSGLGLAISKKIVEMHRGTLDLKSEENSGTTVHIHLPTGVES
ncbi:PAS domain S-box protein [candidate division KSB1 bacterium]|nr:PAS domain S-box protein [candidate division KSB1 bacterium]